MARSKIVGAVEIGTDKTAVLVAEIGEGAMTIIGRGQSTTTGMRKGEVTDLRAVSNAVHAALLAAEKSADARIEQVYLSISGDHLHGFRHPGVTTISSSGGVVGRADLQRAIENAKNRILEDGYVYLHHVKYGYLLDNRPVEHPLQREGSHLEVQYWHVVAREERVQDHLDIMSGYGVEVKDLVIDSLASGSLLARDEEKRQGVMVVDIGKGTTDYVLYRGRRVLQTGVIPVGGEHITNDLSLGLRVKSKYAESLKKRCARALVHKNDRTEKVPLVGDMSIGDRILPLLSVNKIVHARLEELFIILKNRLGSALSQSNVPCGVILTGGVAKTPEIAELAEVTLGVPVSLGQCPDWVKFAELREPEFSTVLGLLYSALHDLRSAPTEETEVPRNGLLRKVVGLFG